MFTSHRVEGASQPGFLCCSVPTSHCRSKRRQLVVLAGEGRSANRTKWMGSTVSSVVQAAPTAATPQLVAGMQPSQPGGASSAAATTDAGSTTIAGNDDSSIGIMASVLAPSELVWESVEACRPLFDSIDRLVYGNIARVQQAFKNARIGPHHFAGSTGYGHGDLGRQVSPKTMPLPPPHLLACLVLHRLHTRSGAPNTKFECCETTPPHPTPPPPHPHPPPSLSTKVIRYLLPQQAGVG